MIQFCISSSCCQLVGFGSAVLFAFMWSFRWPEFYFLKIVVFIVWKREWERGVGWEWKELRSTVAGSPEACSAVARAGLGEARSLELSGDSQRDPGTQPSLLHPACKWAGSWTWEQGQESNPGSDMGCGVPTGILTSVLNCIEFWGFVLHSESKLFIMICRDLWLLQTCKQREILFIL